MVEQAAVVTSQAASQLVHIGLLSGGANRGLAHRAWQVAPRLEELDRTCLLLALFFVMQQQVGTMVCCKSE